jgi:predicted ferric reductase
MNSVSRRLLFGAVLTIFTVVPAGLAAASPLLQWREPIYIIAGFAGIGALILLMWQPLLAGNDVPGLNRLRSRHVHRWTGILLVSTVIIHVAGLWITSPPDVVDALRFASPTPFSVWGVIAMWAVHATAALTAMRRRLNLTARLWRRFHKTLALIIVGASVIHALLIEGTMEFYSKAALCAVVVAAALWVLPRRTN